MMTSEQRKEALRKRTIESSKDRGQYNLGKSLKVPFNLSSLKEPPVWYELKADPRVSNMIDILPFEITNPLYPSFRQFTGKPLGIPVGSLDYKLEIPVHQKIGRSKQPVICRRELFGEPCSICDDMFEEYKKKNSSDFDKKTAEALRPQWRCIYVVYDYRDEKHNGFKLWDVAYKTFEEYLCEKAETSSEEGYVIFSDPEEGKIIEIEGREKAIGKNSFIEPVSLRFLKRETPYTDNDLQAIPSLDGLLVIHSVEEVTQIHYDTNFDYKEEDKQPEKKEERTQRRLPSSSRSSECPGGGVVGTDFQTLSFCQSDCPEDVFRKCEAEYEKLEKTSVPEPEPIPEPELERKTLRRQPVDSTKTVDTSTPSLPQRRSISRR